MTVSCVLISCIMIRYPVTDEVSIRDGLVHVVTGLLNSESLETLRGPEAMRGYALSCSLFASVAIGGLMLGCPETAVAHHLAAARAALESFRGLSDRFAVSALILFAMSNVMARQGMLDSEYHRVVAEARAIHKSLPDKDPLVSTLMSYRSMFEGLHLLTMEDTYSVNPINAWQERLEDPLQVGVSTSAGEAIVKHVENGVKDPGGGGGGAGGGAGAGTSSSSVTRLALPRFVTAQKAHPAYVVTDGE